MITLALFDRMVEEQVAGLIGADDAEERNFFWEEAPLTRDGQYDKLASGVWLITRPGNIDQTKKGLNLRTTVDFYVAFKNKIRIEEVHQAIRHWLTQNKYICSLRSRPGDTTNYQFSNIRIKPTTTPQNNGITENGLFIKVASALLVYDDDLTN